MNYEDISYSVIHSNRKTVSISINREGFITVRAPRHINNQEIHQIVLQKIEWIKKKKELVLEKTRLADTKYHRNYDISSSMPFQGKEYPLKLIKYDGLKIPIVKFEQDYFVVRYGEYDKKKIRSSFLTWYMKMAKAIFMDRITHYQTLIKEPFGMVRIKEQKSCYGSCSTKRNLNFNWKCVLAPQEVLDYIVVHELTHLKEMNHSKKFWEEVSKVYPNYKWCKSWLKENHAFLEI